MARPRKTSPRSSAPLIPSNSLVASAVRYPKNAARIYNKTGEEWQRDCYRHYAICGEARFAARFFGRAMAKAVLKVGKPKADSDGREEVTTGPAREYLDALFNGTDGQAQMLEAIGVHLTIAGECFLVGRSSGKDPRTGEDITQEVWEILSPMEVQVTGKTWKIKYGDDVAPIELNDDDDVVIRIWNPMPGSRMEADSPFRALLPILSEIEWLTRHVFAQVSSRLAGSGILFVPENMTFPKPPETEGEDDSEDPNEADSLMLTLADAMMTPLRDPSSPAALVPIIVTAPGEEIDKAKLMTFWSELDSAALELRSEAIRRFAVGMDLPPEQILGMSSNGGTGGGTSNGVSHWGAWQIEESTIKMFVEPSLDLVVNALTVSYLRPSLDENGTAEVDEFVYHDTSALRLRPDRSKEALELHALGLVSDEVVMRENGFDPVSDAMDAAGEKRWLLRKIASGSATPEQVGAALAALGVDLGVDLSTGSDAEVTRETRPAPSLEDHPTEERMPDRQAAAFTGPGMALLAACDGLVWRALEKAGNRHLNARTRGKDRDKTIDPCVFHIQASINGEGPSLLDGAFEYAPRVLEGIAPVEPTVQILGDYCLALFATQQEHTRWNLAEYLEMRANA